MSNSGAVLMQYLSKTLSRIARKQLCICDLPPEIFAAAFSPEKICLDGNVLTEDMARFSEEINDNIIYLLQEEQKARPAQR